MLLTAEVWPEPEADPPPATRVPPTHAHVGDLLPVMGIQPAPQQGLLRELAAGGDEAPGQAILLPQLSLDHAPRRPCSLDLLDLLLGLSALLLQDLPLRLARHPALLLLQVLQPAGRGRGPGSLTVTRTRCGGLWGWLCLPAGLVAPRDAARQRGARPQGLGSGLGGLARSEIVVVPSSCCYGLSGG